MLSELLYPPNFSSVSHPNLCNGGPSLSSSKEPKKHRNGLSNRVTYYFLVLFLLIEGFSMRSNHFSFDLKLGK